MIRPYHVAVLVMLAWAIPAIAQEPGTTPPGRTFTLAEPVLAGGARLEPGTYEIRLGAAGADGIPQRVVDLIARGAVVARETAEIVPAPTPAATTATTSGAPSRVRVEKLKGGEFVRVSFVDGAERYLIYLPTVP